MPDVTQNVIIDFQTTNDKLQATIDLLGETNNLSTESVAAYKAVNSELQKNTQLVDQNVMATTEQQAIYDKVGRSLINLSGQSKLAAQELLKFTPADVAKGFDELGISVDEYIDILQTASKQQDNVAKSGNTLRTQLLAVRNQMAALIQIQTAGNVLTAEQSAEFDQLALKAGKLSNAIQQTNKITKNLASDTPLIASFAEGVSGLAGAYQAAAGASALFGSENKDLQETLVKVTSVTAIAQGLQQSLNLVKKEGAIVTAGVVIQEKILNAQLAIENGLQSESIVVRLAAAAAQKVLNAAIAVNPIALAVAAIIIFLGAIYEFTQSTKAAAAETAEFNSVLDDITKGLDAYTTGIQSAIDKQNAFAKDAGAAQSTIIANSGRGLVRQLQDNIDAQRKGAEELNKLNKEIFEKGGAERVEQAKKLGEVLLNLSNQQAKLELDIVKTKLEAERAVTEEALQKQVDLAQAAATGSNPAGLAQFAAQRDLINKQGALQLEQARGNLEKQAAITADITKKINDNILAQAQFTADNKLAIDERELIAAQQQSKAINDRTSQEEINAQNKFDQDTLKRTLLNNKLTQQERLAAANKTAAAIADRNRAFAQQELTQANQDDDARNKAELANIQTNLSEQLAFRIQSIQDEAQIEIIANKGKSEQIKLIEAKRDNDILAARKAAIQEAADFEINTYQTTIADQDRLLEKSLSDQAAIRNSNNPNRTANQLGVSRQDIHTQLAAIDQIAADQNKAQQIKIDSLNKTRQIAGSLTDQETQNYLSALDIQTQNTEAAEARKQALIQATADKQTEMNKKIVAVSIQGVADGLSLLASYYSQQDQAAQARLDKQKQQVQDELNAGEITQKAALTRNLELDAQQKKLQTQQAIRNKKIAIFQAIVSGAQAVIQALDAPPPLSFISAAIAGALAAAQLAIISSQPIPQFDKGKRKGEFEGFGQVGERHPELVEQDGRMFLVNKPTTMWLGSQDTVFKPSETTEMLENMTFGKNLIVRSSEAQARDQFQLDYDRFGKVISDNIPQYGLDMTENGLQEWVKRGNTLTKYLNKRRSYRR